MDNLSSHTRKAVVQRFGAEAGDWLWNRFTVHYTPKHGSWLNQAEIAISLLGNAWANARIGDRASLRKQTGAWNRRVIATESPSSGALLAGKRARSLATKLHGHGTGTSRIPSLRSQRIGGDCFPWVDYSSLRLAPLHYRLSSTAQASAGLEYMERPRRSPQSRVVGDRRRQFISRDFKLWK
jgi:hypothetical protein